MNGRGHARMIIKESNSKFGYCILAKKRSSVQLLAFVHLNILNCAQTIPRFFPLIPSLFLLFLKNKFFIFVILMECVVFFFFSKIDSYSNCGWGNYDAKSQPSWFPSRGSEKQTIAWATACFSPPTAPREFTFSTGEVSKFLEHTRYIDCCGSQECARCVLRYFCSGRQDCVNGSFV